MRILITGSSGFLGSAFTSAAVSCGHQIIALSRFCNQKPMPGIFWVTGSLADPPWAEIKNLRPDVCVHFAWIATPGSYLDSQANYDYLQWSYDFLMRLPGIGITHIVAIGSCLEYQITGILLREDVAVLAPDSTYARCKIELHKKLVSEMSPELATLTWARIFYPYGENENPKRLITAVTNKLLAGHAITLRTPHSIKDYIHKKDVASALLTLLQSRFMGAVNVGTGEGVAVETIARKLADITGRPELVQIPTKTDIDPYYFVVADNSRLRALGWSPCVTLENGLNHLVKSLSAYTSIVNSSNLK